RPSIPGHHRRPPRPACPRGRHRRGGENRMIEIHNLDRAHLPRAYGLDSQRLLPWPALNAPFEGAWCILRAGEESTPHGHHEYEVFIAMAGRSTLSVDREQFEFAAGDIVH